MHLSKNRQLSLRRRGDEIILKPLPSLETTLEAVHEKTRPYLPTARYTSKRPLSDEELKLAIRQTVAERADR